MFEKIKTQLYRHKRNIHKNLTLITHSLSLSRIANQGRSTFEESLEALNLFKEFQSSQKVSEIEYLYEKVRIDQPKIICEIGTYKGGSLFLLSQAAPSSALLISVDISYPFVRKLAHRNLIKKGQQLICIEGDTQNPKTLLRVEKGLKGRKIDFLFIDGDHSLFGVMNDYVRFYPLVKEGGLVAFHDIFPDLFLQTGQKSNSYVGGVPFFWDLMTKGDHKFEAFVEDTEQDGFGIGVIYKSI